MAEPAVHRKDPKHLRDYYRLASLTARAPEFVVEFGVDQGGSLLLWHSLWCPERLIGFDISIGKVQDHPLISVQGKPSENEDRPIQAYAADQCDPDLPSKLVDLGIEEGSVDIFIDDADHSGEGSEKLMQSTWRFVRDGGIYVVEDWEANVGMRDFILGVIRNGWKELSLRSPLLGPCGEFDLLWVYVGQSLVAFGKGWKA